MITKKDLANIWTVFKREFFAYFNSPVAYVIIVIFLLATMGFAFSFGRFLDGNNASLTQAFLTWHPWIYVVLAPAVGMRLWSEEHRLGTLELLITMPIAPWHAVVGKYLAAAVVWFIGLALTCPIIVTLYVLGTPDSGPIITGYIASFCYALGCLAVTSAISAFTRSQVVCFIVSVALCFLLTLIGMPPLVDGIRRLLPPGVPWLQNLPKAIAYLSFSDHYTEMTKGILNFRDLLYYVSVVIIGLVVTDEALRSKRA